MHWKGWRLTQRAALNIFVLFQVCVEGSEIWLSVISVGQATAKTPYNAVTITQTELCCNTFASRLTKLMQRYDEDEKTEEGRVRCSPIYIQWLTYDTTTMQAQEATMSRMQEVKRPSSNSSSPDLPYQKHGHLMTGSAIWSKKYTPVISKPG